MDKKIFNIIIGCLAFVGAFVSVLYIYILAMNVDIYTDTTSTYALSVVDPQTGEKIPTLSVNYYENVNGSGKEVVEFRINAYSDQKKQTLYRKGYQLVIEKDGTSNLYYYDSHGDMSWDSGHVYDETNDEGQQKNAFFLEIDGDVVAVRLDGYYETHSVRYTAGDFLKTTWACLTGNKDLISYHVDTERHYYTFKDFLMKIATIISSCSYGTGTYVNEMIDLGDYLHMYEVSDDGHVSDTRIGNDGQINSYFSMSVNYNRNGMVYAGQSMFGSVASDSDFNISGVEFNVNYWNKTIEYNLSESDFVKRYSNIDQGFYYSLSTKTISELKSFEDADMEINIVFDCTKIKDTNILGFDNYALYGIKVNSLKIIGNNNNFNLMVGCLKDTGLSKIITHNVNINNLSGMEVSYEVV